MITLRESRDGPLYSAGIALMVTGFSALVFAFFSRRALSADHGGTGVGQAIGILLGGLFILCLIIDVILKLRHAIHPVQLDISTDKLCISYSRKVRSCSWDDLGEPTLSRSKHKNRIIDIIEIPYIGIANERPIVILISWFQYTKDQVMYALLQAKRGNLVELTPIHKPRDFSAIMAISVTILLLLMVATVFYQFISR